jgi:hypothetical protein
MWGKKSAVHEELPRLRGEGLMGKPEGSPRRPPMLILNIPMEWVGGTSKENNLNIVGQSKRPETNLRERESRNKEGSRCVTVLPTREKTHTLRHVLSIPYLNVPFDIERVDHVHKHPKLVSGSKDIQTDQVWRK